MFTSNKSLRTFTAVALAAALAACGGGGGGGAAPVGAAAVINAVVPVAGTLQAASSGSTYAGGSMAAQAFDALNAARLASGAGALTQSTALDVAAAAHAAYTTNLGTMVMSDAQRDLQIQITPHGESPDVSASLYYEATAQSRAIKSGAIAAVGDTTEGITGAYTIVGGLLVTDGAVCVNSLLNGVYHSDSALSDMTLVSIAQMSDGLGAPGCVVDYARPGQYGQVRPSGRLVVNPAPNTVVSGLFAIAAERPQPAVGIITTATAGVPVLVSMYNADYINADAAGKLAAVVTQFDLRDAAGTLVAAKLFASSKVTGSGVTLNSDSKLRDGSIVLIPLQPLAAGVYSVTFKSTLSGVSLPKDWTFTAN